MWDEGETILDCGHDGLCPGDIGYIAPDHGEGDGYLAMDGFQGDPYDDLN